MPDIYSEQLLKLKNNRREKKMKDNSSNKLAKKVSFRLSESDNQLLQSTADFLGCRPSDAIRLGISSLNLAAREAASLESAA